MLMLSLSSGSSRKPNVEATTTSMKSSCDVNSSCSRSSSVGCTSSQRKGTCERGFVGQKPKRTFALGLNLFDDLLLLLSELRRSVCVSDPFSRGRRRDALHLAAAGAACSVYARSCLTFSGAFFSIFCANCDSLSIKSAISAHAR
jgi:hypothetical protein